MPNNTCLTAQTQCTFGAAPSILVATPKPIMTSYLVAANIMDNKPIANVVPFGMCSCPGNPAVASATAAAMGVLTPMPCVPNIAAPWAPGSPTVMLANQPALNNTSKLACVWGGVISFVQPGETTHNVP